MKTFLATYSYILVNINLLAIITVFLLGLGLLLGKVVEGWMGGLAFSRLMRCLSCADRERGGGTGLVQGLCGDDNRDNCSRSAFVNDMF